jgi:outer membrane receptor protein involved in Fe transport
VGRRHPLSALVLAALVLAGMAPGQARAQQAEDAGDRVRALPTVEVIGQTPLPGGISQSRDEYPGNVQVQDDGAIERAHADTLPDFMKRLMGSVSVNEIQGSPFQLDLNYRGHRLSPLLGSSQGLSVYVDGVRFNEALGDVMNWDLLPEAAISTLTLVPGSNPLYGLNTLGGALVLTTKSGLTHKGTEMDLSVSSFGRRRLDVGHGVQWGEGWHGYVAATLFDEDGWRERSPGRLGNLFLKVGRKTAGDDWTLSYSHANSNLTGNGLVNESLYAVDRRAGYTFPDTTRNRADFLAFNGKHVLNDRDQLSATAWYRRSTREGSNGDISDDWSEWLEGCEAAPQSPACSDPNDPGYVSHTAVINRTSVRQRGAGAGLQWSRDTGTHRMALGTEVTANRTAYDQFEQDGFFDSARVAFADPASPEEQTVALRGKSRTLSLFATDVIALSTQTHLTLSGRWNQTHLSNELGTPAPPASESFTYSKLNPAIGLTHALEAGWNVFGSASQGTRVPTSIELGCADPTQPCTLPTGLQADPYLKQVVARTLELGVRSRSGPGLQLAAALFRTASQDDILFVRAGASQAGYFTNVGKTLRQGVELSARWRGEVWQWYAHYTYLRATYESTETLPGPLSTPDQPNLVMPGTRLAGLPSQLLKVGVEWRATPALRLGADVLVSGSQVVAGNESGSRPELGRIAGSAILNARASWQFNPRWQAYVRVSNLTDRRYANYGAGNVDLFPGGRQLQPGEQRQAALFLAPGAPRALGVGLRYEWDQ